MKHFNVGLLFFLVLFLASCDNPFRTVHNEENRSAQRTFQHAKSPVIDIKAAEIAWNYFENNYNVKTGLVNGLNKYRVIRPEHIGHTIMATIAAKELELISPATFNERMKKLLKTLKKMKLYHKELPNLYYDAKTAKMVTKSGKPTSTGNGWNLYSIAHMMTGLYYLQRDYPIFREDVFNYVASWDFKRAIAKDRMKNRFFDGKSKGGFTVVEDPAKEYYIHNALKLFNIASYSHFVDDRNLEYKAPYTHEVPMGYKYPIANGESYLWSMMEHPYYLKYKHYSSNIYLSLKDRYETTGKFATSTEEALDRKPYWVANDIYHKGKYWTDFDHENKSLKNRNIISAKAAFIYCALYGYIDNYAGLLMEQVKDMKQDGAGWYGGKYNKSAQSNKSLNIATNAAVLESIMYKKRGNFYYAKEPKLLDKIALHHIYVKDAFYIESKPIEMRYDAQKLMESIADDKQVVRLVRKGMDFVVRIGAFKDKEGAEKYLEKMDVMIPGAKIAEGEVNSDHFMLANRFYKYDYRYPYKNAIISKENKSFSLFLPRYKVKKQAAKQKKSVDLKHHLKKKISRPQTSFEKKNQQTSNTIRARKAKKNHRNTYCKDPCPSQV